MAPGALTVLQAIAAVAAGIAIPVAGYVVKRFLFDPIARFRAVSRNIDRAEAYYGDVLGNPAIPGEATHLVVKRAHAARALRGLGAQLPATYNAISCQRILAVVGVIPKPNSVDAAARALIALSDSTHAHPNTADLRENDRSREVLRLSLGLALRPSRPRIRR